MNRAERRRLGRLEAKQHKSGRAAAARRSAAVRKLEQFGGVSVLGALAAMAVPLSQPSDAKEDRARVGILSTIASVAVRVCDEQGPKATVREINELLPAFSSWHPTRLEQPHPHRAHAMLASIVSPQAEAQRSILDAYTRTYEILTTHHREGMPDAHDWAEYFGVKLEEFMLLAFGVGTLAIGNQGLVDRRSFTAELAAPLAATSDDLQAALNTHLFATWDEHQHTAKAVPVEPGREDWAFNPLMTKPVVVHSHDSPVGLCPFPLMALQRGTLTSLYFDGRNIAGEQFAGELGYAVEDYVESVLRSLVDLSDAACALHTEIVYDKSQRKSADFFVVFDELVLVIEVKAARQIEHLRQGHQTGVTDMIKKISKAADQIETSADLIHQRHGSFTHIPSDRPIRGLVVTLEPWPTLGVLGTVLCPIGATSVPTHVISIDNLERIAQTPAIAATIGGDISGAYDQSRLVSTITHGHEATPPQSTFFDYLDHLIDQEWG